MTLTSAARLIVLGLTMLFVMLFSNSDHAFWFVVGIAWGSAAMIFMDHSRNLEDEP